MKRLGLALILVVCILSSCSNQDKTENGNNKQNIIKSIKSLNDKQRTIEIIKIFDFKESRYVAYLHDNIPAYIYFKKDKFGNYKSGEADFGYTDPQNKIAENLQVFPLFRESKGEKLVQLVVTNHENVTSKLSIRLENATGSSEEKEINVGKASAGILTMYKASNAYSLDLKYFDENGKQIH